MFQLSAKICNFNFLKYIEGKFVMDWILTWKPTVKHSLDDKVWLFEGVDMYSNRIQQPYLMWFLITYILEMEKNNYCTEGNMTDRFMFVWSCNQIKYCTPELTFFSCAETKGYIVLFYMYIMLPMLWS